MVTVSAARFQTWRGPQSKVPHSRPLGPLVNGLMVPSSHGLALGPTFIAVWNGFEDKRGILTPWSQSS